MLIIVGAAATLIGLFLPALRVFDHSVSLFEFARDAQDPEQHATALVGLCAGLALAMGLGRLVSPRRLHGLWVLIAAAAVGAGVGLVVWPVRSIVDSYANNTGFMRLELIPGEGISSLEWGFWICVGGIIVMLVGALFAGVSGPPRPSKAPATGKEGPSATPPVRDPRPPSAAAPAAQAARPVDQLPPSPSPRPATPIKEPPRPPRSAAQPGPVTVSPPRRPSGSPAAPTLLAIQRDPRGDVAEKREPEPLLNRPPVDYLYFSGDSTAPLFRQMEQAEAEWRRRKGYSIVEAVWESTDPLVIRCAVGEPDTQYRRVWPEFTLVDLDLADHRKTTRLDVAAKAEPEASPLAAAPETSEDVSLIDDGQEGPSEPNGSALPTRPMKICPDCAETVLNEAKICRFCRYDFRLSSQAPESESP